VKHLAQFLSRGYLPTLVAALIAPAVLTTACDDPADESTKEEEDVSPTPPLRYEDDFQITTLALGEADEGVDVDGDGEIDNSIEVLLNALNEAVYEQVAISVCSSGSCTAEQEQVLVAIQVILDAVFSVDAISTALNTPIENGTTTYLLAVTGDNPPGDATLVWVQGAGDGSDMQEISTQAGYVKSDGFGAFGPDDLTLSGSIDLPGNQDYTLALTLYRAQTELWMLDQAYGAFGGAASLTDTMDMVYDIMLIIEQLVEAGGDTLDVDAIMIEIETALQPYTDIDLDEDGENDAYSVGLVYEASVVVVEEGSEG